MKRTILCLLSSLLLSAFCLADANHAALIPAKHHIHHHRAHKAGKHHTPKRHGRTV